MYTYRFARTHGGCGTFCSYFCIHGYVGTCMVYQVNDGWLATQDSASGLAIRPRLTPIEDTLYTLCREAYKRYQQSKGVASSMQQWAQSARDNAVQGLLRQGTKRPRTRY
eukprot:Platyproteum_vivax@DN6400_c0_g1_i2.p1